MNKKEQSAEKEDPDNSRRKFMFASAVGAVGLATGLSMPVAAKTQKTKEGGSMGSE